MSEQLPDQTITAAIDQSTDMDTLRAQSLAPKSGVIGKIRLEKMLARGGMGVIYHGRHTTLDIDVAVKILPRHLATDRDFVRCLFQEARSAARINHPNVVRVYDCDEEDGLFYLVMEFVHGMSCDTIMEQKGRFSEREASRIIRNVAMALAEISKHGMLHRDIKPSNIMIAPDGGVKLTDLGLAITQAKAHETAGDSDEIFVTPEYMAPEMAIEGAVVDHRSDIYSLGATFYHFVTGECLFSGATPSEVMRMQVTDKPRPVRELAPGISAQCARVIEHMLAKDPASRYQNANELLVALADIDGIAPGTVAGGLRRAESKSLHDLGRSITNAARFFQRHAGELLIMGCIITLAAILTTAITWLTGKLIMGWTGFAASMIVLVGMAAIVGPLLMGLYMATMKLLRASQDKWQIQDLLGGFRFFPEAFCLVLAAEGLNYFAIQFLGGALILLGAVVGILTKSFLCFSCYLVVTKQAQLRTVARKSLRLMGDDYVGAFIVGFIMWLFEYATATKLHFLVYLAGLSILLPFTTCLVFHFQHHDEPASSSR